MCASQAEGEFASLDAKAAAARSHSQSLETELENMQVGDQLIVSI